LPPDVEEILDRDGNAGKARRRCLCATQPVDRVGRRDRGFPVDVDEGALALPGRIGNFRNALLNQLTRGGAASFEIVGQCGQCRRVRHDYFSPK
jgi:hypothetical protein